MESSRTFKERVRVFQIGVVIATVFIGGFFLGSQFSISAAQGDGTTLSEDAEAAFEPLYQAYNLIQEQSIYPSDAPTLVNGAISGMVDALGDQYSNYTNPELYQFANDALFGEVQGIGVEITEIEETGQIEVVNVLEGTPAEAAGVEEGDIFIEVNGEDVAGLNTSELALLVRGPEGTDVNITMLRDDEPVEFTITRARITIVDVSHEVLDDDIGYIRLRNFSVNARSQVEDAINAMDVNNLNGLIIDLRGNPGGLLTSATEVASLLIEDGAILVEDFGDGRENIFKAQDGHIIQVDENGEESLYSENGGYAGLTVPIVLLIDGRSASASEIVAGAWQEAGVATLIGTTTFGKGTVQQLNTLVNGGGLKLTIARFLTPNREVITEVGITPDMVVEMPEDAEIGGDEDPQLNAAIEYLLEQTATPTE